MGSWEMIPDPGGLCGLLCGLWAGGSCRILGNSPLASRASNAPLMAAAGWQPHRVGKVFGGKGRKVGEGRRWGRRRSMMGAGLGCRGPRGPCGAGTDLSGVVLLGVLQSEFMEAMEMMDICR